MDYWHMTDREAATEEGAARSLLAPRCDRCGRPVKLGPPEHVWVARLCHQRIPAGGDA